jgi:biotin-dependent carboxylase-like uncharacterized protein
MTLYVRAVGPAVLVQDLGRPGWAHLGVPRSGALDPPAAAFANRLVGNAPDAACLEVLLGGLAITTDAGCWAAVTGATCDVTVDGRPREFAAPVRLAPGGEIRLGTPFRGLRSYVAFAGGIDVEPVLGSRSRDTLGGVGPPPLEAGDKLEVGSAAGSPGAADTPRPPLAGPLHISPGPHAHRVDGDPVHLLCRTSYVVSTSADRIGMRLTGVPLPLLTAAELPSGGMVLGAVQVPPDGLPVLFLADHPTTGGYPVVAVVDEADLWQCAQLRPGEPVRFARSR